MLSSMNANPKDPFFIASVPRYKENIAEDNNDSIGDEYFERLASEQLAEENQAPPPKKEPTVPSTRRSVMPSAPMPTRRSVMPVMPMPSSRRSVMPPATPLMNTNSRRPSSFSVAAAPNTVAKQPVIVQPPMRFGGGANTARRSVLPTETRVAAAATRRSVMPAPSTPSRPSTAKPPVIVQPPMRFGNVPTTRRSVMPEAQTTSTASGSNRAPKPNDISHAVRGIPVRRSSRDRAPSRDKQPK